jgi:hypothetical protein
MGKQLPLCVHDSSRQSWLMELRGPVRFVTGCFLVSRVIVVLGLLLPLTLFFPTGYVPSHLAIAPVSQGAWRSEALDSVARAQAARVFRWLGPKAKLHVPGGGELILAAVCPRGSAVTVQVAVTETNVCSVDLGVDVCVIRVPLPSMQRCVIDLQASGSFIPAEVEGASDTRELSFQLVGLSATEHPDVHIEGNGFFGEGVYPLEGRSALRLPNGLRGYLYASLFKWDAMWYASIVVDGGYDYNPDAATKMRVAFFPLYPLAASLVGALPSISGQGALVLLAVLFSWLGLVVTYVVCGRLFDDAHARFAVAAMSFFPGALFLGLPFSEGLFLLLVALFLYAYSVRAFWAAAVVAGLATATRSSGIVMSVVLMAPLGWRFVFGPRRWHGGGRLLLQGLLSIHGLLGYMLYLWWRFDEPLAFAKSIRFDGVGELSLWEAIGRFPGHLAGLARDLHHAVYVIPFAIPQMNILICLLAVAMAVFLLVRRQFLLGSLCFLFTLFSYLPMAGLDLSSHVRYASVNVPLFMALAQLCARYPTVRHAIPPLFAVCLFLDSFYYAMGVFVA